MNHFAAQLVSGKDDKENWILSLIVKKDYHFNDKGQCVSNNEMPVFVNKCSYYENNNDLLEDDNELVPYKLLTDVVIQGKAHNPNLNTTEFKATVQIGNYLDSILVKGNRKAFYSGTGLRFTEAEKVDEVPLRYDYAYGGRDVAAIEKLPPPDEMFLKFLAADFDLYADTFYNYPRNAFGKGYIVEADKQRTIELPNLEDPDDLLTPENLIVGDLESWQKMPLPRCTDWQPSSFFPRVAYIGILENFLKAGQPLKEVSKGWADKSLFLSNKEKQFEFNFRCTNAASLGLQLPQMKREEYIRLINIHPRTKDFTLTLPKDFPKIWVDGRKGKMIETRPVIHTILVKPGENKLSVIWRGSAPAIRPYMSEELAAMPFRIEWR